MKFKFINLITLSILLVFIFTRNDFGMENNKLKSNPVDSPEFVNQTLIESNLNANNDKKFLKKRTYRRVYLKAKKEMNKEVQNNENHSLDINIYPIPATEHISVNIFSPIENNVYLELISINGIKVFNKKISLEQGSNDFQISINTFEQGTYHLILKDGTNQVSTKLLIQR